MALSLFGENNLNVNDCGFRKLSNDGILGPVMRNERTTLEGFGITDGMTVVLEKAEIVQGEEIKVIIAVEGKRSFGEVYVFANLKEWKLSYLKEEVCKQINHPPSECRLKMTKTIWNQPTKLLDDENKTLLEWKIDTTEVLWLEDGKAPYKGQIDITLETYTCFIFESIKETGMFYSPILHLSSFCKFGAIDGRDYKTSKLCSFDFSCYKTLLEMKNEILKLDYYKSVPSPYHLRIFQNERLIKKNGSTLRKQNINTDARLTVQVIDYPDNSDGNGFLLFLHKRLTQTKRFDQIGEYWWKGTTLEDLIIDLSNHTNVPVEFLLFATYEIFYDRWVIFYNGVNEPNKIKKYLEEKEIEKEKEKKRRN